MRIIVAGYRKALALCVEWPPGLSAPEGHAATSHVYTGLIQVGQGREHLIC